MRTRPRKFRGTRASTLREPTVSPKRRTADAPIAQIKIFIGLGRRTSRRTRRLGAPPRSSSSRPLRQTSPPSRQESPAQPSQLLEFQRALVAVQLRFRHIDALAGRRRRPEAAPLSDSPVLQAHETLSGRAAGPRRRRFSRLGPSDQSGRPRAAGPAGAGIPIVRA